MEERIALDFVTEALMEQSELGELDRESARLVALGVLGSLNTRGYFVVTRGYIDNLMHGKRGTRFDPDREWN